MQIQVEYCGKVAVVVWPQTRLDASNADEIGGALPLKLEAYPQVVLDLSALRVVDSFGLGALLDCLERRLNLGRELKLGGVCKPVRTSFELLRLHRLVDMFSTKEEAVSAYRT